MKTNVPSFFDCIKFFVEHKQKQDKELDKLYSKFFYLYLENSTNNQNVIMLKRFEDINHKIVLYKVVLDNSVYAFPLENVFLIEFKNNQLIIDINVRHYENATSQAKEAMFELIEELFKY